MRINPDELHCADPYFVEEIYTSSPTRIRDKWQHQLNTGGAGPVMVTAFSTVAHELHRSRRAPLMLNGSPLDERRSLSTVSWAKSRTSLSSLIICWREKKRAKGEPFNIKEAFNCFTADVISQYAFGESMGFVAQEKWEPNLATQSNSFFKSAYMMRHNSLARERGSS